MKLKNLHEFIIFGKVLSAGLVVGGYAFLGVWVSDWLIDNGWNKFVALMSIPVIMIFGMWQGYLFLTKGRRK